MLISRQRELLNELQGKIRSVRDEGSRQKPTALNLGDSEVDAQDDLEFVLIQMKAETANKINEALLRLEEGRYGLCFECGERDRPGAVARAAFRGSLQGLRRRHRDGTAARSRPGASGFIRPRLRDARLTRLEKEEDYALTAPRVGTFEPEGEAVCVTTQVAVRPSSCCRGTPARPSQSCHVRRRSDRSCPRGIGGRQIAGSNGLRRSARLRRELPPAPGRCEARARSRASRTGEGRVVHRASDQPPAGRTTCRSPAETPRSAARYPTDGRAAAESGCRRR